jgi:hypothetical protein
MDLSIHNDLPFPPPESQTPTVFSDIIRRRNISVRLPGISDVSRNITLSKWANFDFACIT